MKILIASKNPGKIQGIREAFEQYTDIIGEIEVKGISVDSNVSDEPVNEEIVEGAINRIGNLRKYCADNSIEADLYVAVESGINNFFGSWMITNIGAISDKSGYLSIGTSASFPVPNKYVDEIIKTDLAKVMDKILKEEDLRSGKGGIGIITKGKIPRTELTKQAVIMAYTKFINGEIWR